MMNPSTLSESPMRGATLTHGTATGPLLALSEPLSFWGGYDAPRGLIIESAHPNCGASLAGQILMMPRAKGSSSSSSVLAEAIRLGTGPAGIILRERDLIIAIGAIVASDLYGIHVPVVVLSDAAFDPLFARALASTPPDDRPLARIVAPNDTLSNTSTGTTAAGLDAQITLLSWLAPTAGLIETLD